MIKQHYCQDQVAKKLNLRRQTVNEHVKALEILGFVQAIDPDANPKFYKPTCITPVTGWGDGKDFTPVVSGNAKQPERRVHTTYKAVRSHKTGQFKGERKGKGQGHHRDYDTIISEKGRRLPILRMNCVSYTCAILHEPVETVPWEKAGGPNGMEQWVLHHAFKNKKVLIEELREMQVTFVRKKTKNTDELIIYLPEKYLIEYELRAAGKIMEQYATKAWKWFQKRFKAWLGQLSQYRDMEYAREIFEPGLKRFVQENGMKKVMTANGYAVVDESVKGYPEREFTSVDEVEADLHMPERVLSLEQTIEQVIPSIKEMLEEWKGKIAPEIEDLKKENEGMRKLLGEHSTAIKTLTDALQLQKKMASGTNSSDSLKGYA